MGWLSQTLGQTKENQAAAWLKQNQIQLLHQNYRCKGGELDLIGLDSGNTLLFIEVKYRKNSQHGHPSEFVTPAKQQRVILCAQTYLQKHPQYQNHAMRFDLLWFENNQTTPNWVQDAFQLH